MNWSAWISTFLKKVPGPWYVWLPTKAIKIYWSIFTRNPWENCREIFKGHFLKGRNFWQKSTNRFRQNQKISFWHKWFWHVYPRMSKYCLILRGSRANEAQHGEFGLRICATHRNFVWDLYFQKNKNSTFSNANWALYRRHKKKLTFQTLPVFYLLPEVCTSARDACPWE